jgi:hypothetical protein
MISEKGESVFRNAKDKEAVPTGRTVLRELTFLQELPFFAGVDLGAPIGDRAAGYQAWVGGMKRFVTVARWAALAGVLLAGTAAQAQTAVSSAQGARKPAVSVTEASSQRRKLRRVPIYRSNDWETDVYPRYNPGPNAVRDCTASYVQERRPSGTVITPRMNCYWRPG